MKKKSNALITPIQSAIPSKHSLSKSKNVKKNENHTDSFNGSINGKSPSAKHRQSLLADHVSESSLDSKE